MLRNDPLRSRGQWRASIRGREGWRSVRGPQGAYCEGGVVEWGSITKGAVASTAALSVDLGIAVREVLPEYPEAEYSLLDLIEHRAGLPRLPRRLGSGLFRDPYAATVGERVPRIDTVPVLPRGTRAYSNLGFALLGQVLDRVHTDWFIAAKALVLDPAGITSVSLEPPRADRILPRSWRGKPVEPWILVGSPYSAAAGLWSTFADLCRYADWAVEHPSATRAWQRQGATTWINGQVKSSGTAIVATDRGTIAVAHALEKPPGAADKIAVAALEQGQVL